MSTITIVSNNYIRVEYDPDRKIIQHVIHQPISAELLFEALSAGTEAMRKYGACKWLSDDRKNGSMSEEGGEEGNNDWIQQTIEAGWKYWALLVPERTETASDMFSIINDFYNVSNLRMMVFTDREEALAWLDQFPD